MQGRWQGATAQPWSIAARQVHTTRGEKLGAISNCCILHIAMQSVELLSHALGYRSSLIRYTSAAPIPFFFAFAVHFRSSLYVPLLLLSRPKTSAIALILSYMTTFSRIFRDSINMVREFDSSWPSILPEVGGNAAEQSIGFTICIGKLVSLLTCLLSLLFFSLFLLGQGTPTL